MDLPSSLAPDPTQAAIADFNLDGTPDVAIASRAGGVAVAVSRPGDPVLDLLSAPLTAVRTPHRIVTADFDHDGDPDLLVTCDGCAGMDRLTLYLNRWSTRGLVSFAPATSVLGLPAAVDAAIPVVFDADGDRDDDILLLPTTATGAPVLLENRLDSGALGFGDVSGRLPDSRLTNVAAAVALDVNLDGRSDVYIVGTGPNVLLVQQSNGDFVDRASAHGLTASGPRVEVAAADIDGSGGIDIVTVAETGEVEAWVRKKGVTSFQAAAIHPPTLAGASGLAVIDLTGDRQPELIVTAAGGGELLTLKRQPGSASPPAFAPMPAGDAPQGRGLGTPEAVRLGLLTRAVAFSTVGPEPARICYSAPADSDGDGLPDFFEVANRLDTARADDAKQDYDMDGVPNWHEFVFDSHFRLADSDGDGSGDAVDLLAQTDLDGDGIRFAKDDCPAVTNRRQRAGDGRAGDVCGVKGGLTTILVAKSGDDYGLLKAREIDAARLRGDQQGMLPFGSSFKLFRENQEWPMRRVVELWHPQFRDHAYVVTSGEEQRLVGLHYRRLGELGFVAAEPLAHFPEAVEVRRFRRAGPSPEEAVTADREQANALLAHGYVELDPLGWAVPDEGRFTDRTDAVVRYRRSASVTLHSSRRSGDVSLAAYGTDGVVFRVLPEQSGWTLPLWRLRKNQSEVLSADPAELVELEALGYRREGVLGHIYPMSPVETKFDLLPLVRLSDPVRDVFVHSVDPAEIFRWVREGYGRMRLLGRVIRRSEARPAPDVDRILAETLARLPDPHERGQATLKTLAIACAFERALTGRAANDFERGFVELTADADAETRAGVLARVRAWRGLELGARASALGRYNSLDPLDCSSPIEPVSLRDGIHNVLKNEAPLFGNPLRAPQCVADAAPGSAVTVVESAPNAIGSGDVLQTAYYAVAPKLYGVRADPYASSVDGLDDPVNDRLYAYRSEHPEVGLPLVGVALGPCTNPAQCDRKRGEMCVAQQCRAYPMILPKGFPTFTGASFWDKRSAKIRFREVTPGGAPTGPTTVAPIVMVNNWEPPPDEQADEQAAQLRARCDPEPSRIDRGVKATLSPAIGSGGAPGDGPAMGGIYTRRPNEAFLDTATADVKDLAKGKFYRVEIVNQNGSYLRWDERLPIDGGAPLPGRTVHVCTGNRCTPPTRHAAAACELADAPICGAEAGGVWATPPCAIGTCPDTPAEFVSPSDPALPQLVYVPDDTSQWLNTKLHQVHCIDETGWDAFGEDEFMIFLGSLVGERPTLPQGEQLEAVKDSFGAWTTGIDAGERRTPGVFLSSLEFPFQGFQTASRSARFAHYGVVLGEDDDNIAQILIAGLIGGGASFGLGMMGPGVGTGAAAGAGAISAAIIGAIAATDPDDALGQSAWVGTIPQVRERGLFTHDTDPLNPQILPLQPFVALDRDVTGPLAESHAAADGVAFERDALLQVCATDMQCAAGGRVCVTNVCVPPGWVDATMPPPGSTGTPGHVEYRQFRGAGAHYDLRLTFSVTDRTTHAQ